MAQRLSSEHLKISIGGRLDAERRVRTWSTGAADAVRQTLLPEAEAPQQLDVLPRSHAKTERGGFMGRLARLLPRLVVGGALVMLALALALFAFRTVYSGRVYPAVVVGDVPVGGLTLAQAEERLDERASQLEQGLITFTHGEQSWTPRLSQLGASIDMDHSLADAHARGREDDAVTRLTFAGSILQSDLTVPVYTSVDGKGLNAWFNQVDNDLGQPAVNAAVVAKGLDIGVSPDADGLGVDRAAARALVLDALTTLEPVTVPLPTTTLAPQIRVADLGAAQKKVAAMVAKDVTVAFEDEVWTVDREALAPLLLVETGVIDGKPDVTATLDQKKLSTQLREEFAEKVNRKPINAEVDWDDDELVATEPSVDGVTLKASSLALAVTKSFTGNHHQVKAPVVVTKPEVDADNLDALKIDKELASGDSYYNDSPESRIHNIGVGADLLDGTLVKPGEKFSFNRAIGEIDHDKGFVDAKVVVAERAGKGVGGGICQVSTTVFRAALRAGMPITEWHPHTYRLKYYDLGDWGPGWDASILQSGDDPEKWADFEFENDTGGWLLVESWADYPKMVVTIYGQDDGREVEFSDTSVRGPLNNGENKEIVNSNLPPGTIDQTEWPQSGWETVFWRYVYDKDGNLLYERDFYIHFHARGNVYQVSPDMKGRSPAG